MLERSRLWSRTFVVLVFFTALSTPLQAEASMEVLLDQASSLLHRGKVQKAIRKYEKALRIDASAPDAVLGLSAAYLMAGDDESAARYAGKAAELAETVHLPPEADLTLGRLLFLSSRSSFLRPPDTAFPDHSEEALRAFRRALLADRDRFASARYYLAEILTDLGRRDEALAELDAYLAAVEEPQRIAEAENLRCYLTAEKPPKRPEGASIEPPRIVLESLSMSPQNFSPEAVVTLRILIDENGDPVCVRTLAGRPPIWALGIADQYRQAKFQPGRYDGRPVAMNHLVRVRSSTKFRLETPRSFAHRALKPPSGHGF